MMLEYVKGVDSQPLCFVVFGINDQLYLKSSLLRREKLKLVLNSLIFIGIILSNLE